MKTFNEEVAQEREDILSGKRAHPSQDVLYLGPCLRHNKQECMSCKERILSSVLRHLGL